MSENYIMIMMVLGVLSFDTSNPHLQHFSVHASDRGRLNHIARSDGCGPKNHGGNFGGFDAKTIFNCNVSFSDPGKVPNPLASVSPFLRYLLDIAQFSPGPWVLAYPNSQLVVASNSQIVPNSGPWLRAGFPLGKAIKFRITCACIIDKPFPRESLKHVNAHTLIDAHLTGATAHLTVHASMNKISYTVFAKQQVTCLGFHRRTASLRELAKPRQRSFAGLPTYLATHSVFFLVG